MKVVFHEDFYPVYTSDPAAAPDRMESVVEAIDNSVTFITARPALEADIAAVHTGFHIEMVKQQGLFDIAALSAGGWYMKQCRPSDGSPRYLRPWRSCNENPQGGHTGLQPALILSGPRQK